MVTPTLWRVREFFERAGCGKLRDSKHHKVRRGDAANGTDRYPLVQCHESSVVLDGQSQEVQIGQLPRAVNVRMLKLQWIQEADLIRPKCMVRCSRGVLQHADQHRQGLRAAVPRLPHDAKAAILGQCTGGPALLNVRFKPLSGTHMVNMIPVM